MIVKTTSCLENIYSQSKTYVTWYKLPNPTPDQWRNKRFYGLKVTSSITSPATSKERFAWFLHMESVNFEKAKAITKMRWTKVTSCAKNDSNWADETVRSQKTSNAFVIDDSSNTNTVINPSRPNVRFTVWLCEEACAKFSNRLGFHETCYRRFIHNKRINAQKWKLQNDHDSQWDVPSPKRRRARARLSCTNFRPRP